MATIRHDDSKAQVLELTEEPSRFYTPTEADRNLLSYIEEHTSQWRDYRDQNYRDDWERYERIFRGKWEESDKTRQSERSRVISPATQQAVETRHAEVMEAIFGQGEFFDIKDDIEDATGTKVDVEQMKARLYEDFAQDKIRKSIEAVVLLAEIYGTGIAEITVGEETQYKPMLVPHKLNRIEPDGRPLFESGYGAGEKTRTCVKLTPVNPNNFLFDPNGTSVDDCLGVAIEKYVSIHKIASGINEGKYRNIDVTTMFADDSLEATQERANYKDNKVLLLTYYGLVPREYIEGDIEYAEIEESEVEGEELEDYSDLVEAIVVVANGSDIIKAEISPYMMRDRPVLAYQADTVPNRLLGRGTVEKAFNMQVSIDGSMRSHMDALALTTAPMMGMDATRLPRGAKFQVKPGGNFMVNGNPNEILFPFKFGTNDGQAMTTSKEFERMLLMATGTVDSAGQVTQVSRDGQMDMATATLIKKYKRTLVNFQEDFLIPFINKAAWRYMQFSPERYPSKDVKFIPTGTLGIIAREYEQKQLAFLIQTLGAESPLTPVLMQGIIEGSSNPKREEMLEQLKKLSQPNPQHQQLQQQVQQLEMQSKQADTQKTQAEAMEAKANAEKATVEAKIAPDLAKAKIIAALSNNLDDDGEGKDFERRAKIAELLLKEEDIKSNERIAKSQMEAKVREKKTNDDYVSKAAELMQ